MTIAIDLDETKAETLVEVNKFYNEKYNTNFKLEDYHIYDFQVIWGTNKKETTDLVQEFYRSSYAEEIKPVKNSQEIISLLSKRERLIDVTARPVFMQGKTEKWVEKYYSGSIDKVICTGQYNLEYTPTSKLDVCLEESVDIIIEDNLETCIACAEVGMEALLVNKPWNQSKNLPENITRVGIENPDLAWKEIWQKLYGN